MIQFYDSLDFSGYSDAAKAVEKSWTIKLKVEATDYDGVKTVTDNSQFNWVIKNPCVDKNFPGAPKF